MFRDFSRYLKLSLLFALTTTLVGKCPAKTPTQKIITNVTDSVPSSEAAREGTLLENILPPPPPLHPVRYERMFVNWEVMPLFPGSDATRRYAERKHQADSLLLSFIYGNLRYPCAAFRDSVQGMAVVSFVVENDGAITGARVVRNPGAGTGEEALRVINLMAERNMRWVPGTQGGKPVRVQFHMPFKFKITEDTRPYPPAPPLTGPEHGTARKAPTMPLYPGCTEVGNFYSQRECSDSLMRAFIYGNLSYPYRAYRDGVEGIAVVSFTVGKDGRVSSVKLARDPGGGTGYEALRLVQLMARKNIRWVPATRDGKPVKVEYKLPIRFKITRKTVVKPPPPAPPPPPKSEGCEEIFKVVEEMPRFPGCEELVDEAERKNCSDKKLIEYVYGNLKLPEGFATNCSYWSETAVVQFCVEENGMVTDAKIIRGRGDGIGGSALNVVNDMNANGIRWTPGRQGGRAVRVQYNVPVRIRLE